MAELEALDARIAAVTGGAVVAVAVLRGRRGRRPGRKPGRPAGRRGRPRGRPAGRPVGRPAGRRGGARGGKSLKQYLAEALASGQSKRTNELTQAVLDAGYKTLDRNFRQTVASTLAGNKQFRRVRRGIYKLAQ